MVCGHELNRIRATRNTHELRAWSYNLKLPTISNQQSRVNFIYNLGSTLSQSPIHIHHGKQMLTSSFYWTTKILGANYELITNTLSPQTSIGTGYDLSNSVFSPDGRNFQVEYAVKAVENGGTSIGIRCKDGVVLAVEKVITSKLLKPGANKRIATIDRHIGAVSLLA